jgi:hypothetical protein
LGARIPDKSKAEPKGWARIGAAYRNHESEIKWEKFSEALDRINEVERTARKSALYAEAHGLIDRDEKLRMMFAFPKEPVGRITKALNVMLLHVTGRNLFGPPLPDSELGYRIAEEIDRCILCLKEVQDTPRMDTGLEAMLKVAAHGLDSLLQEFGRLMILRQCELCRRVMFPSSDRKRFCSDESEGRDCGHRAANKSSYERSRATKGRMTPRESAKKAAKAKWARDQRQPQDKV